MSLETAAFQSIEFVLLSPW